MKKSPNSKKTNKKEDELTTGDETLTETSLDTPAETTELSSEPVSVTETTPEVETVATAGQVITPVTVSSVAAGSSSSSVSSGSDGIGALGKALVVGLFILLAGIGLL